VVLWRWKKMVAYKVSAGDIEDSGGGGGIVDSVKNLVT
jgi:hypothetical protein